MDKQSIIANVNPKRKAKSNRKAAAAKLREESFNKAYQKEKVQGSDGSLSESSAEQKETISQASQETEKTAPTNKAELASESPQEASSPTEAIKATPEADLEHRRGPKRQKSKDGGEEVINSTINVPQDVSKAVKLASTLMENKIKDFTTDAIRHYLKHLKKTGKLPDMPALDI
jgi:hypothetical protein